MLHFSAHNHTTVTILQEAYPSLHSCLENYSPRKQFAVERGREIKSCLKLQIEN